MEEELQLPSVFLIERKRDEQGETNWHKKGERRMKDLLLGFFVFVSGVITGAIGFIFSILLLAEKNKVIQRHLVTSIKDFIVMLLYGESRQPNHYNGYYNGFRDGASYTSYCARSMGRE